MVNTRSAVLVKAKEVSLNVSVDDDRSKESEINIDNPELEMPAIESEVGHELGAPVSTVNENNNETNEQSCSNKKSFRKSKKSVVTKEEKEEKYEQAVSDFLSGKSKSIRKAANKFGVAKSALYRYIVTADSYKGQGRKNVVLTEEEERKIVDHILFRKTIGCGMSLYQVQLLIQEVLIAVCSANPDRTSPYADSNHMPNKMFVSRFVSKHGLTLRAALEISKGRQILTKFDLEKWQQETQEGLVNHPKFQDCFLDSSRIFNQD